MWIIFGVLIDAALDTFDEGVGVGIFTALIIFAFFVPAISVGARRLHDIGRSGWWRLLYLPTYPLNFWSNFEVEHKSLYWVSQGFDIAVAILFLIWALTDGTKGDNRFGPDPKGRSAE